MRRTLRMIDKSDFTIAGVATFFGLCAQQVIAALYVLSWSLQTVLQGLITIGLGLGALTAQHFLRRFLRRRWPDRYETDKEL